MSRPQPSAEWRVVIADLEARRRWIVRSVLIAAGTLKGEYVGATGTGGWRAGSAGAGSRGVA